MMFRSTVLAAATFIAATCAQRIYEIDPETVPESLREHWCLNSQESCPLICSQYDNPETLVNTCDPETLTYGCLCGDNIKPNMSEYSLTIPYFTCVEWGNQCVEGCGGDPACGTTCREDNPCGAQDPERVNTTATESTANPTSSAATTSDDGTTIFTGTPGGDDDDDDSGSGGGDDEGAASMLTLGRSYGLSVVMGTLFIGFALF